MALIVLAAFNFVVNPYAQYGTDFFEPAVQESRARKVELMGAMQPAPEGLVLGSSRVLKLEPSYLQLVTGLSFFNAGVNYGKPEDYLAILRCYQELHGKSPKLVLLGLDPIALSEAQPIDARLLGHPMLAKQIPELVSFKERTQRWSDLLDWNQTKCSIKTLRYNLREPEAPHESFNDNGLLVYHDRESQIAAGTYDFQGPLEYNKNEYRQFYLQATKLSARRCLALETLFDVCESADTQVVVFATPLHPDLQIHLQQVRHYEQFREEFFGFVTQAASSKGHLFKDLSRIEAFSGDPNLFFDGIHPREENTRRMLDTIFTSFSKPIETSEHAIQ